jgi:N-acetylglucosamine kinase-like BadF-type ATPase
MILAADSGSTKCDWIPIENGTIGDKCSTVGFNPYFCDEEFVFKELSGSPELSAIRSRVKEVHFFGAGCSSPERNSVIERALERFFPNAAVAVEHDVMASVLATCGDHPGIACILGTGSNSCYYDGSVVHENNYGLGYIMGDEGSGSYFGKKLITHYLYNILPVSIRSAFEARYVMNKEIMIENVYGKPGANVWLASFAKFLSEHPNDPWVCATVKKGFEEFFDLYVCNYPDYRNLDVHFVGSIAHYFEEILRQTGREKAARVGKVIRHPINGLAEYYRFRNQ